MAGGSARDGTAWVLDVTDDPHDRYTMVRRTRPDGRRPWGVGCGGPAAQPPGRRIAVGSGVADDALRTFIARVRAEVRSVVVTLSDGTREVLHLHGDISEVGAGVAVLVRPPELDIHRVDPLGRDGRPLPEDPMPEFG